MNKADFKNRTVTIRPVGGEDGRSILLPNTRRTYSPVMGSNGKLITGHTLKEEESYKDFKIDEKFWKTYYVVLTDREQKLNLDEESDIIKYRFLKGSKEIANSTSEITSKTLHVLYDEVSEAKETNVKFEDKVKALNLLSEMSQVEKSKQLGLYGINVFAMNPEVIMKKLQDEIEKNPTDFVARCEDENKETKSLIRELVEHRILRQEKTAYYYNETVIGINLDLAINYLKEEDNAEFREQMIVTLREKQEEAQKFI